MRLVLGIPLLSEWKQQSMASFVVPSTVIFHLEEPIVFTHLKSVFFITCIASSLYGAATSRDFKDAMRELYIAEESTGNLACLGIFRINEGVIGKISDVVTSTNTEATERRIARGAVAALLSDFGYRGVAELVFEKTGAFYHDASWVDSAFTNERSLVFCKGFYGFPKTALRIESRAELVAKCESRYRADMPMIPGMKELLTSRRYEQALFLYAFLITPDELIICAVADDKRNLPPTGYLQSYGAQTMAKATEERCKGKRKGSRAAAHAYRVATDRERELRSEGVTVTNRAARCFTEAIVKRQRRFSATGMELERVCPCC